MIDLLPLLETYIKGKFEVVNNMGMFSPNPAYFISSALESFLIQKNTPGKFFVNQETLWSARLYDPSPNVFWALYTKNNVSTIIWENSLEDVVKNLGYILQFLQIAGFSYEDIYIAGNSNTLEFLSDKIEVVKQCNVLALNSKFQFSAPNIDSGEYVKLFYIRDHQFVAIADVTISIAKKNGGYFSDSFLFTDNIAVICRKLKTKYDLEKYYELKNDLNQFGITYTHSHLELLYAIIKCLEKGVRFGARGRSFILKEILKVYFFQGGSKCKEFWAKYSGEQINRIEEIYARELEIYSCAVEFSKEKKTYDPSWKIKFGITKKTYDYAYQRNLDQNDLIKLRPKIPAIYVEPTMSNSVLANKLDRLLIERYEAKKLSIYEL